MFFLQLHVLPVSALKGDNIIHTSLHTPWYKGPSLMSLLDTTPVFDALDDTPLQLQIQYVFCDHDMEEKRYAGLIWSGTLAEGQIIKIFPSGDLQQIKKLYHYQKKVEQLKAGQVATFTCGKGIELRRGDYLFEERSEAHTAKSFFANICWMDDKKWSPSRELIIKMNSYSANAKISKIISCLNVENYEFLPKIEMEISMNEICLVEIETEQEMVFDYFENNKQLGSFIFIDSLTNNTVAGGVVMATMDKPML